MWHENFNILQLRIEVVKNTIYTCATVTIKRTFQNILQNSLWIKNLIFEADLYLLATQIDQKKKNSETLLWSKLNIKGEICVENYHAALIEWYLQCHISKSSNKLSLMVMNVDFLLWAEKIRSWSCTSGPLLSLLFTAMLVIEKRYYLWVPTTLVTSNDW